MQQQILALIAGLMTVLGLLINLTTAVPAVLLPPEKPLEEQKVASPWPMLLGTGEGTVFVNGISMDLTLTDVRAIIPDFPGEATNVYDETGRNLQRYEFHRAEFLFDGDELVRIGIPHTPEGLSLANTFSDATGLYGSAVHAYKSTTGHYYAVFVASELHNTAWVVDFDYSSGKLRGIWLANNLSSYLSDAEKEKQNKAIREALKR